MATLDSDAQTDASEVKEVFDTDLPDATIHAYINVAVVKRKEVVAAATDSLPTARQAAIEKYLAAHFLTAQDPRPDTEKHESLTVSYGSDGGEATDYLEIATSLDPTGTLNSSGQSATIDVPRVK